MAPLTNLTREDRVVKAAAAHYHTHAGQLLPWPFEDMFDIFNNTHGLTLNAEIVDLLERFSGWNEPKEWPSRVAHFYYTFFYRRVRGLPRFEERRIICIERFKNEIDSLILPDSPKLLAAARQARTVLGSGTSIRTIYHFDRFGNMPGPKSTKSLLIEGVPCQVSRGRLNIRRGTQEYCEVEVSGVYLNHDQDPPFHFFIVWFPDPRGGEQFFIFPHTVLRSQWLARKQRKKKVLALTIRLDGEPRAWKHLPNLELRSYAERWDLIGAFAQERRLPLLRVLQARACALEHD